jgi:two-component system, chemotaxis family, chemotaxis protein CheY
MEKLLDLFATEYESNGLRINRLPLTILIVDDSNAQRTLLGYIFRSVGYSVVEAEDVNSGLEMYRKRLPDVVTMDLVMPGMSGLQGLLEFLDWDYKAKMVVVSTEAYRETVKKAIANGAKNFFAKPITETNLKQVLTIVKSVAVS